MASSATSTTSLVAGSCLQAAADSQAHAVVACWLWGTAVLPHYTVEMRCWLLRMVDQVVERSGLRTRRSMPIDNGVWRLGIALATLRASGCSSGFSWVVSLTLTKQSSYFHALLKG